MRIEQGQISYKDLGYDKSLSKAITGVSIRRGAVVRGDFAGGDLEGVYPRPTVDWGNMAPTLFSQAAEPSADDISAGRMAFWEDTDDSSKLYLCFNQSGTIKTVLLE